MNQFNERNTFYLRSVDRSDIENMEVDEVFVRNEAKHKATCLRNKHNRKKKRR